MTTGTGIRAHHFTVGALACAIVSDGSFAYHDPASLLFANAPQPERDSALRAFGIDAQTWHEYVSPYSALLIDTGQHKILVDTGAGGFAPTNGYLLDNLKAEGVDPATIDTVVLTHAHPDHIGGNLDGGLRPAFPNARYVLWRDEWQFWTGAPDLSTLPIPEPLKELLVDSARRNLPPLESQVALLERDTELAPGVRAIAAPGHTPGHLVVAVASDGERLLWSGDALLHPMNVHHPEWCAAFDLQPDQAIATRGRLLSWAADEDLLLHGAHFPWPGLGRVRRADAGFRWQSLDQPQTHLAKE
jgi:glyoxylase-like metal-dependent hydrolase (beta-lactamase superfamily II)